MTTAKPLGMSTKKKQWPLAQAYAVALLLKVMLEPYCDKIAIAGSIRRQKPEVSDIELLCVPNIKSFYDLFNGQSSHSLLDEHILALISQGTLAYRLNSKSKRTFGPLNKLLIHTESGIPLDVFCTDAKNWGMAYVVRTGPKDFNIRLMQQFRQLGMEGHAYKGISKNGAETTCPDEETVFRLAGWPYTKPEERA